MEKEPTLEFFKLYSCCQSRNSTLKMKKARLRYSGLSFVFVFVFISFGCLLRIFAFHASVWGNDWKDPLTQLVVVNTASSGVVLMSTYSFMAFPRN